MPKPFFEFKKFTIYHDKCAMKVGTDGVLLGAWTQPDEFTKNILDIGTGSGLIAIMLAQNSRAEITGIDIDADAIAQACDNAERTLWKDRLHFIQADALMYSPDTTFDLIVCNPPFFVNSLQSPSLQRNRARHSNSLPFQGLADRVCTWLNNDGIFNIILPSSIGDTFIQMAWERGLNLSERCYVKTKEQDNPKRVLLSFKKGNCDYPASSTLIVQHTDGAYTDDYKALTKDFYLRF